MYVCYFSFAVVAVVVVVVVVVSVAFSAGHLSCKEELN